MRERWRRGRSRGVKARGASVCEWEWEWERERGCEGGDNVDDESALGSGRDVVFVKGTWGLNKYEGAVMDVAPVGVLVPVPPVPPIRMECLAAGSNVLRAAALESVR